MHCVEALLNAGNRIFNESAYYWRKETGEEILLNVSIESRDVIQYSEEWAGQAFRFTVFSCDAKDMPGGVKPQRGDALTFRGVPYRVVEFDGVTWKPRFDPFDGRIIFFTETQGARRA